MSEVSRDSVLLTRCVLCVLKPAFNAYPPYNTPGPMPASYPPAGLMPASYPPAGPAAYPTIIPPHPVDNVFHHNYPPAQPHVAPMPAAHVGGLPGHSTPAYNPASMMTYDRGFQVLK